MPTHGQFPERLLSD
uniref:Uncharacterized protein n=1 Tax=Anguilla anguilla TaxID=7936 RepID=A0A0E9T7G9_ANGAN